MDFSVKSFKGLAAEAATVFTRAVQYTEERLGTSDKTELDAHFETLAQRSDRTKYWTERLVGKTEAVLQPNPNVRVEDYLFEKLDKKRDRLNNTELLGQDMIDAGTDFGPGTSYGSALIKVGQAQQKLGQAEREFGRLVHTNFVQPLRRFLDGDMKTILKERRLLENKRLDLDAAKNRLRKAKATDPAASKVNPEVLEKEIQQAEKDVRSCQSDFDRQAEITRLLLEGISSTHVNHLRCLSDFVEAQMSYYAQCQQYMADLQKELANMSIAVGTGSSGDGSRSGFQGAFSSPTASAGSPSNDVSTFINSNQKRARVLYDYDAHDNSELSLMADEVIIISQTDNMDPDWMIGERGLQKGKVPIAYLEILN
ncbi:endophilin-B1 isoform X3 [Rhipicephalus sanguineus]|uniref:endophilin-B1 isoform X3 n=1 Tax=Rhipicephalus sanguineus TaxID=34632 RepID=UPI00189490A3|nr:endophilin-B1 isoform X3 [Rhipicephalus sanguineus]